MRCENRLVYVWLTHVLSALCRQRYIGTCELKPTAFAKQMGISRTITVSAIAGRKRQIIADSEASLCGWKAKTQGKIEFWRCWFPLARQMLLLNPITPTRQRMTSIRPDQVKGEHAMFRKSLALSFLSAFFAVDTEMKDPSPVSLESKATTSVSESDTSPAENISDNQKIEMDARRNIGRLLRGL